MSCASSPASNGSSGSLTGAGSLAAWFGSLPGEWRIARRLSNGARFRGTAVFRPTGSNRLLLQERGKMRLPTGPVVEAWRDWVWALTPEHWLEIRFAPSAGGGIYHRLRPALTGDVWRGGAVHPCGHDRYCGLYDLAHRRIAVMQSVRGPAKDYRLTTILRRELPEGS